MCRSSAMTTSKAALAAETHIGGPRPGGDGWCAAELLIQMIENPKLMNDLRGTREFMQPELAIRASTGPAPRQGRRRKHHACLALPAFSEVALALLDNRFLPPILSFAKLNHGPAPWYYKARRELGGSMQSRLLGLFTCLFACGLTPVAGHAQAIVNGSFTDGAAAPANWEPGSDNGRAAVVRDTKVFASAPFARIDAVGGSATGKCQQSVPIVGNKSYRFKGKLKTSKTANGGLAMVMFASGGRQTGWNEVAMVSGTQEWCAFDAVTFMPPTTELVVVMVYADLLAGGSMWMDDLSIEPVPDAGQVPLFDFRGSALRSPFDSWLGNCAVSGEGMTLQATGKGGSVSGKWFDLSKRAGDAPVMELKVLPGNTATDLKLTLTEQTGGERVFQYQIPPGSGGFVAVSPSGNATLTKPSSGATSAAPGVVNRMELRGNGNDAQKLAVVLRIELVPPGGRLSPVVADCSPR